MAITWVQGVVGAMGAASGVSSAAATGSSTVGSGNCVVVAITDSTANFTDLTSVTDDKSNTYTLIADISTGSTGRMWLYFLANITNGPKTITANFVAASASFPQVMWDEYSGATSTAGSATHYQNNPGTGTDAITSNSFTPSAAGTTIYSVSANGNGTITTAVGTGYTKRTADVTNGDWGLISEDKAAGAGANTATFTDATNGSSNQYLTIAVALSSTTIYTKSLTESGSAVDTVTETMTASWTLTESGSAADSPTELMTASWTLTESGSAADSPSSTMTASWTLSEAGSGADSPTSTMTASWTIAESDSAADNLSIGGIVSLFEAGNAIDTLTFTLIGGGPPPVPPYGIYQPKDLQHAIQWWFQAQQALQQAIQNGDPSQIPQLMRQIRRWVGMINALRLAQAYGVKSEATRQKLMYCAPIWPNQGEN